MGKIKAVFFDIDGTLVSFKTHRIPQSTLDAVAALRSRGIKVYIATGRPVPFIDNLGELEYDGMITVTGAHCFTRGGEIIFHRAVSTGSVERVVEHLTHGTDAYPVIFVCSDEMFITKMSMRWPVCWTSKCRQFVRLRMPAEKMSYNSFLSSKPTVNRIS